MTSEAVVRQFEQNFFPLTSTLKEPRILVLYGPPCAGKTTVAKEFAAKYNCHFVSIDELRMHYPIAELFTDGNNAEVLEVFLQTIRFLAEKQQAVICEGMFYSEERKLKMKTYLAPFQLDFFYLTAPVEILLDRLTIRNARTAGDHMPLTNQLTSELLRFYYNQFLVGLHEEKQINTAHHTTADVIDIIARQIERPNVAGEILTEGA